MVILNKAVTNKKKISVLRTDVASVAKVTFYKKGIKYVTYRKIYSYNSFEYV